jgi:hypothetical protein
MTPLEQTVLDVLSYNVPMATDDVFYLIPASATDIVTALESLRNSGHANHMIINSVSLWQRREKLLVDIGNERTL